MKEEIVSFETAKIALEKGFNESVEQYYIFYVKDVMLYDNYKREEFLSHKKGDITLSTLDYVDDGDWSNFKHWNAPSQGLLHRWLREKHGIYIVIIPTVTSNWTFKTITVLSERDDDILKGIKSVSDLPPYKEVSGFDFSSYEEALEDGLIEGLKLIS